MKLLYSGIVCRFGALNATRSRTNGQYVVQSNRAAIRPFSGYNVSSMGSDVKESLMFDTKRFQIPVEGQRMSEFSRLCQSANIEKPMLLFVGAGNMGSALLRGCKGFASSSEIAISDTCEIKTTEWKSRGFDNVFTSTATMISTFPHGIIFFAVKPQSRHEVYDSLSANNVDLTKCPLFISILAGIGIDVLEKELFNVGYSGPIIRLMPNIPVSIGSGASVLCASPNTGKEVMDIVEALASKVGLCIKVDSNTFNAYGVIAGCVPAWAYVFIEALADGGVLAGCSRENALKLAAQSVLGAAEMILTTGEHPAVLKDRVCSPAGTTIAGLRELEKSRFRFTVTEAVKAATERSSELS